LEVLRLILTCDNSCAVMFYVRDVFMADIIISDIGSIKLY